MKMTTTIAFENMKYHRSKNILTGITILLTTLLLFVILTVGKGAIDTQYAAINKIYPTWHALFREMDRTTAEELAAHHDIVVWGLRSDVGMMDLEGAEVSMLSVDAAGAMLYRMELVDGSLPVQENDIVVSEGILRELGQQGQIGDTITVPCQIIRDGELDYTQQREFRICGFLEDSATNIEMRTYIALLSQAFIESEIPEDQIVYRFLFQVSDAKSITVGDMEAKIRNIAEQFGISDNDININQDVLEANNVDESFLPSIVIIMLIVMSAGIITIYSIYYTSMNQRIQEFGRLKAIGATKRQMKQIILREGLCVAALAIPVGLLLGTVVSRIVLLKFISASTKEIEYISALREVIRDGEVPLYHWWIYLLTIAVTIGTVYISLIEPMNKAARVSEVEAMRFHDSMTTGRSWHGRPYVRCLSGVRTCPAIRPEAGRRGYEYLTIGRLTGRNLAGNKKKSAVTILSMSLTGMLLMVVATVLSCVDPAESASSSIVGQYELSPIIEDNNREHPERKWIGIQQNNPLNEELKQQIEDLEGVIRVDSFTGVRVTGAPFESYDTINGIPEEYAEVIEKGILEGNITYEELKSGDKVVIDRVLLYWYPELEVGTKLNLIIHDGERSYEKEIEIAAIGEYDHGLINYHYLIMAKEAADRLCENNSTQFFHVIAEQDYDPELEKALAEMVKSSGRLEMNTWQAEYENWKISMTVVSGACYAFLGILAAISVMNLINTMINSVHVRRKELGMMQAIGMSDRQLMKMLQLEGLFSTFGTLLITVGLGSLAGYPLFRYAKSSGMFQITTYHYPWAAAIIVSVVLLLVQAVMALAIAGSVKKVPLIERIRFSE